MDVAAYVKALRLPVPGKDVPMGGQELILGEVIASLYPHKIVWMPYPAQCQTLVDRLRVLNYTVQEGANGYGGATSVYFGTPTIVNDKALFPCAEQWTKEKEQRTVATIATIAETAGLYRIVCGLGSGDINPDERIEDINGGRIVAMKKFEEFYDWVIVRDIKEAE